MRQEEAGRDSMFGSRWRKEEEARSCRNYILGGKKGRIVRKRIFSLLLAMLLAFNPLASVTYAGEENGSELQVEQYYEDKMQKKVNSDKLSSINETPAVEQSRAIEESQYVEEKQLVDEKESVEKKPFIEQNNPIEEKSQVAEINQAMEEKFSKEESSLQEEKQDYVEAKIKPKFPLNTEEEAIEGMSEKGIRVLAKYPEASFPVDVQMEVKDIREEALLEKLKEKALQRASLEEAGEKLKEARRISGGRKRGKKEEQKEEVWEIESLSAVDISFYVLTEEGEKLEVQPKKGKTVEIILEEAFSEGNEEKTIKEKVDGDTPENEGEEGFQRVETKLQVLHLDEQKGVEYLESKEDEEGIRFQGKRFSPYAVVRTRRRRDVPTEGNNNKIQFHAFWSVNATANKDASISYTNPDYNAADEDTKKSMLIKPGKNYNMTLGISYMVNFIGGEGAPQNYPTGSINIYLPAAIFKGKDGTDQVAEDQNSRTLISQFDPGDIVAAPDVSKNRSNYTKDGITKMVNGVPVPYIKVSNTDARGPSNKLGAIFSYNFTPTLLKYTHDSASGEKGVYELEFPVFLEVDQDMDGSFTGPHDASIERKLKIRVESKVNPSTVELREAKKFDAPKSVYFQWDPTWGPRPADADNYFYGLFYGRADRAKWSTQALSFVPDISSTSAPVAGSGAISSGQLIGVKRYPQDGEFDTLFNPDQMLGKIGNSPKDIAKEMGVATPSEPRLENPMGKTSIFIAPEYKTEYKNKNLDYKEYASFDDGGYRNTAFYAFLYRYPKTDITTAQSNNQDLETQPLKYKSTFSVQDIWQDGYSGTPKAESTAELEVYVRKNIGGIARLDKFTGRPTDTNTQLIKGMQTLLAEGTPVSLSYSLFAGTHLKDSEITWNGDHTAYTTANGSKAEISDGGRYTLFSMDDINSSDGKPTESAGALSYPSTGGDPYVLSEDDYSYESFYLDNYTAYDVEYNGYSNEKAVNSSKAYTRFAPIEVYGKKKGGSEEKLGELYMDAAGNKKFRSVSGVEQDANSQKPVSFPEGIKEIRFKNASSFYETGFTTRVKLRLHPTEAMKQRLEKDLQNKKNSFIAAPAEGKLSIGDTEIVKNQVGEFWNKVGYQLSPANYQSVLEKKSIAAVEDDPATGRQRRTVTFTAYNDMNIDNSYATYLNAYKITEGSFYDLLPLDTKVLPDSIEMGDYSYSDTLPASEPRYEKGKDYTVEFIPNWEDSGQTMMKIKFKRPGKADWFTLGVLTRNGIRVQYKLENSYSSIIDNGANPKNNLGFVDETPKHKSKANLTTENFTSANYENKEYFKPVMEISTAEKKGILYTEANVDYKIPTGVSAGFVNRISTEIKKDYIPENVSYAGDPYVHKLMYSTAPNSKTADYVLYDILGTEEERNGDFDYVDFPALLRKKTYDANDANTKDTAAPVVYYATVKPDETNLNVDDSSIWTVYDPENHPVDKKSIVAIAVDVRKTTAGKPFYLPGQSAISIYVHMNASTEKRKFSVENTNKAITIHRSFTGNQPNNTSQSTVKIDISKHRILPPISVEIKGQKFITKDAGNADIKAKGAFNFTLSPVGTAAMKDEEGNDILTTVKNPEDMGGEIHFPRISFYRPGTYQYKVKESGTFPGVTNDPVSEKALTVEVKVDAPNYTKLSAEISYDGETELSFTNHYSEKDLPKPKEDPKTPSVTPKEDPKPSPKEDPKTSPKEEPKLPPTNKEKPKKDKPTPKESPKVEEPNKPTDPTPKENPLPPSTPTTPPREELPPIFPVEPPAPETPGTVRSGNIPPADIPRRRQELKERRERIEKRIGEILGQTRPLTEEEQQELKELGEVLSGIREEERLLSRQVSTGDRKNLRFLLGGFFLSVFCLGGYIGISLLKRRKKNLN